MQTVNFQCGQCGNLMAVTTDMLGQQVRCPHCQHVVVAPAATAEPVTAPLMPPPVPSPPEAPFNFAAAEERESIFTPDEQVSEDVFGAVPRPVLDPPRPPPLFLPPPMLPPSPFTPAPTLLSTNPFADFAAPLAPPQPERSDPFHNLAGAPVPAPAPPPEAANPFAGFAPPPPANAPQAAPSDPRAAPEAGNWSSLSGSGNWTDSEPSSTRNDPHPDLHREPTMRVTARANSGWLTVAVVVPLISYSILATILIAVLYARLKNQVHPLEALPDVEGDNTGARKLANFGRTKPTESLPDKLKVALGNTIRIGDLEVRPTKVEQKKIRFLYTHAKPDDSGKPCLVLHLELKNVSEHVVFKPTDPVFLKRWEERQVSGMPYTFLEMGNRRFYGPIHWQGDRKPRERADCSIEGHNSDRELKPGDTMSTIVCTHPGQNAPSFLSSHQGKLLWRVQLRRGLVQLKNREVSATAVIGVEFTKGDIKS